MYAIKGTLKENFSYWSKNTWVSSVDQAEKYESWAIAYKEAKDLILQDLHRESTTGRPRLVSLIPIEK